MRALAYWIGLSAVLTFTACKFDSPESAPDSATPPTVGFATASTLVDEKSGLVQIPVLLSAPATATVGFRVSGGTATRPADFVRDDGSLEFTNAGSANIEIAIQTDNLEEADETIELELTTATGATLGQTHHTVTISSDILPRVSIVGGTVSELEDVAGSLALHLDLPPKAPVSVDLVLAGSAQAADYAVIAQTVVFGVNETDKAIPLGVVDDAIDEDDQTIDVDLAIPVGLVIDVAGSHATHTILEKQVGPVDIGGNAAGKGR